MRRACSGFVAGAIGGGVLVCLIFALDIAHLRSLVMAGSTPLSVWDLLKGPVLFGVLGMTASLGSDGDGSP